MSTPPPPERPRAPRPGALPAGGRRFRLEWTEPEPLRYVGAYLWLVVVSTLDLMLTWVVLAAGGAEVNPIARAVIDEWEFPGAIAFKYSLVVFVVIVCEVAGRDRDRTGRVLAHLAVLVSALPVAYSVVILTSHLLQGGVISF